MDGRRENDEKRRRRRHDGGDGGAGSVLGFFLAGLAIAGAVYGAAKLFGLWDHEKDEGFLEDQVLPDGKPIKAPVQEPGKWVRRVDFKGRKSFGFFQCKKCEKSNTWVSARAQTKYNQACKKCETAVLPDYMWQKTHDGYMKDTMSLDLSRPHHRERCEACTVDDCCA